MRGNSRMLAERRHCLKAELVEILTKMASEPIYAIDEIAASCGHKVLYEKAASKATSAEPPPRWAIGTGQLSCLQFRSGPIARRGGGGIMPFSIFVVSARTCPFI